jgi:cysteine-rich repeat protein
VCISGAVTCGYCGNGAIDPGETCDDGNQNDSDACSNACIPNFCGSTALSRVAAVASTTTGGNTAAKAIDDSITSRWESVQGVTADPSWIYIDLGVTRHISGVQIDWESASAKTYLIQVAQNGDSAAALATDAPWLTVNTSPTYIDHPEHRIDNVGKIGATGPDLGATGRYVRLKGLTRASVYGYSPYEIYIYGDASTSCTSPPLCNNNIVQAPEACDDGNTITESCAYGQASCTVCNSNCQNAPGATAYCGDGVIQASSGETCDDGNAITDECASYGTCTVCNSVCQMGPGVGTAYCGDSVVQISSGESCDHGANNGSTADSCSATCLDATCNDGLRNQGEENIDCGGPCGSCSSCLSNQFTLVGATALTGTPANAINGAVGAWTPTAAMAQWIYVDLGVDKQINRIQLEWGPSVYAGYYTIQVAPNGAANLNEATAGTVSPWTSIHTQLLADGTANVDNVAGLNAKGRYVRIYYWQLNSTTATAVNLNEIKVFGDDDTLCAPDIGSCGLISDVPANTKYENSTPGNTCSVVLGGAACNVAAGGTGTYTDMNASRSVLSFANVDGGTNGGAATVFFSAAAATGTNTRVALYVKYADGTEQGYGIVTLNALNNTTFVNSARAQVYLKGGTGNVIELRDASAGTRPRIDYMMVDKLSGANHTCVGAPFKIASYDNGADFGSRDAGTPGVTTGDFRAITDKLNIGNSNNTGPAGDKYQLTYGTTATYRVKLSNMSGLDAGYVRLKLNANGISTLTLDLTSNGTTFSTAVALVSSVGASNTNGGYGGIPSNGSDSGPDGIVNVPISAFGLTATQLKAVHSIRLRISSNTEWRIRDISLVK